VRGVRHVDAREQRRALVGAQGDEQLALVEQHLVVEARRQRELGQEGRRATDVDDLEHARGRDREDVLAVGLEDVGLEDARLLVVGEREVARAGVVDRRRRRG
jgi:hypothetical protein